jgi:hypothetical protein
MVATILGGIHMRVDTVIWASVLSFAACSGSLAQSETKAGIEAAAETADDKLRDLLLSKERRWYEVMSLRDENWIQRTEQFERLSSMLAKDFRAVTGWDELLTADQLLAIRVNTRLNKFVLSDPHLLHLGDDAAILTYKIEEEVANRWGGYKSVVRAATTWKQQDGVWLAAYYQSTSVSNSEPFKQP